MRVRPLLALLQPANSLIRLYASAGIKEGRNAGVRRKATLFCVTKSVEERGAFGAERPGRSCVLAAPLSPLLERVCVQQERRRGTGTQERRRKAKGKHGKTFDVRDYPEKRLLRTL